MFYRGLKRIYIQVSAGAALLRSIIFFVSYIGDAIAMTI